MKHSLTAIAVSALALSLAACGGEESATPAGESADARGAETTAPETTKESPAEPVDLAQTGRRYFTVCAVCHATTEDAAPRQGPNLKGVYGAPSARFSDYRYSKAMREAGLTWTEENLDAYLENPQKTVPGNNMAYVGERNPEKRQAIIAYLKSLSDDAASEE